MYSRAVGLSDVGRKREQNEDAFSVDDELGLYIVSDGMGGHAAGEVASATTVQTIVELVVQHRGEIDRARRGEMDRASLAAVMRHAIEESSRVVYELATSDRARSGMGCTATALLCLGPQAILAHVGDSRLYLCRNGEIWQMSQDHSLAQELVRAGYVAPEEAKAHPHSHILTRSVGPQASVQVDTLVFDLLPKDRLLLCSDGLSDYLDDAGWLCQKLEAADFERIPSELVAHANQAGGKDNITALVVGVEDREPDAPRSLRLREGVASKFDALGSVFLFEDLPLALRARVLESCRSEALLGEQELIREGEVCSALFIVTNGRCELTRSNERLCELGPGDFVGLTALLNRRPARATLRALTPCTLLRLEQESFWALVRARPWLGVGLLERLGRRLSTALDTVLESCSGETAARLPGGRF